MTPNTFFYFFSTVAQCFAGVVGLGFVAIQLRIAFLDSIVTAAKRVVIVTWSGYTNIGQIEHEMATHSASEILEIAEGKADRTASVVAARNALRSAIRTAQTNRRSSQHIMIGLFSGMTFTLLQVPFSESLARSGHCIQVDVLAGNCFIMVSLMAWVAYMIVKVLDVRTKRRV